VRRWGGQIQVFEKTYRIPMLSDALILDRPAGYRSPGWLIDTRNQQAEEIGRSNNEGGKEGRKAGAFLSSKNDALALWARTHASFVDTLLDRKCSARSTTVLPSRTGEEVKRSDGVVIRDS